MEDKSIWTIQGVEEAVRMILNSRTTLFDSMIKHIHEYPELKKLLYMMLFQGEQVAYSQYNRTLELARMFGYVKHTGVSVQVSNRIFETCLYNLFLSEEEMSNYYIEAQTRDAGRTDVVVDYAGEQFVIEMKIWRGNEYHERGEKQLVGYLDYFHLEKGYLLSFNFNKKKKTGIKTLTINGKVMIEAVV